MLEMYLLNCGWVCSMLFLFFYKHILSSLITIHIPIWIVINIAKAQSLLSFSIANNKLSSVFPKRVSNKLQSVRKGGSRVQYMTLCSSAPGSTLARTLLWGMSSDVALSGKGLPHTLRQVLRLQCLNRETGATASNAGRRLTT